MPTLADHFQDQTLAISALDKYYQFAVNRPNPWNLAGADGKLGLYHLTKAAFGPDAGPNPALAFGDIYWTTSYWMGNGPRLAVPGAVWSLLTGQVAPYLWGSTVTLATLRPHSAEAVAIDAFLPGLWPIRQNQQFPHMAVSKILHFANPSLFPIWDTAVIWNTVMWGPDPTANAPFSPDYIDFCSRHSLNPEECGARFLLNYALWAAELTQSADPSFMAWFSKWMNSRFAQNIADYQLSFAIPRLYATAFEFVLIGAAQP